jgi:tetratricopeptide (TPR) repeat protein
MSAGHPHWYGATVATTWAVSIEAACQEQSQARTLLAILAYLAPDDIPRDLVHKHAHALDSPLREVAGNPVTWDLLLGALLSFSLVAADPERISIHRLVQQTIRNQHTPDERSAFQAQAVRLLASAFPDNSWNKASWPASGRLLPHVWRLADSPPGGELGTLLHRAGRYLHRRGDYPNALRFLRKALEIRTAPAGQTPTVLEAETLTALSRVYYHTADLAEARECTERALELYRRLDGEGSRPVIENTIHLSRVLRELRDFDGAERIARDLPRVAPPGPLRAAARLTYGDALWRLGRLEEARAAYRDALAMRQNTSADPLDLAACHKHLGIVSAELDDLVTAERELLSARELLIQDGDEGNLEVADVDNHLADVLRRTGRAGEARDLLTRVIDIRDRLVGPHPDLAGSLQRYGAALAALGDYSGAIDALQRAQTMFAERMGPDHPYVAEASVVYADALNGAGRPDEAVHIIERALSIYRTAYGDEHRVTKKTRVLLDGLRHQGDPGRISSLLSNAALEYRSRGRNMARPGLEKLSGVC